MMTSTAVISVFQVSLSFAVMGSYVKNYLGYNLSNEEMESIPYPYAELITHVTAKTVEAGVLLGTVGGALAAAAKSSTRNMASVEQKITKFGIRGAIAGFVLGPALTVLVVKKKGIDHDGLYDRCFRLRHNRGQVRIDRSSDIGAVTGAGVSFMAGKGLLFGAFVGCTCGILATTVLNAKGVFDK